MLQGLYISPKARHTRPLSTIPSGGDDAISKDEIAATSKADRVTARKDTTSGTISNLYAAEERQHPGWAPSEMTASQPSYDAAGVEGNGRAQSYEYRPLVERPRWGDRPQQAGQYQGDDGDPSGQDGEDGEFKPRRQLVIHARPMPVSPSYFSRQPEFNDSYLLLQRLMRKYAHLPIVPSDQLERVAFRTLKDYRLAVGEHIKASAYARCMTLVKRLNKIHPKLAPPKVKDAIAPFLRDINPHIHKAKDIPVDKFGRTLGVGKRKTSIARAWVVEGVGEVLVNGKSLADAFGRIHDRESAVWALKATARTDKYNVWALVEGGGTTGQAEALAMAVGKALMAHEPALKPALRRGEWAFTSIHYESYTDIVFSWCCHSRSQRRGKEKAWPSQGKEETCLGQALRWTWPLWPWLCVCYYSIYRRITLPFRRRKPKGAHDFVTWRGRDERPLKFSMSSIYPDSIAFQHSPILVASMSDYRPHRLTLAS